MSTFLATSIFLEKSQQKQSVNQKPYENLCQFLIQDECTARPVPCELCGEQIQLDQMEAHIMSNVGSHILALLEVSQSMKKENEVLKKENDSLKERVDLLEKQVAINSQGVGSSENSTVLGHDSLEWPVLFIWVTTSITKSDR